MSCPAFQTHTALRSLGLNFRTRGIRLTGDEDLVSRVPFRVGACLFLVTLLNLLILISLRNEHGSLLNLLVLILHVTSAGMCGSAQ